MSSCKLYFKNTFILLISIFIYICVHFWTQYKDDFILILSIEMNIKESETEVF